MDFDKLKVFMATLKSDHMTDDELISKTNSFFAENCLQLNAEFVKRLLEEKAVGNNISLQLIEEYAYLGAPAAQVMYGVMKLEGQGIAKNEQEAIFWLKRAFNGKNPNAGVVLSAIYANGIGVAADMQKALAYAKVPAELGVPKAQYCYALLLLENASTPVDEDIVISYMVAAANNGHAKAIKFLQDNNLGDA
ncbi:MAG: sel1 repeat family protein [Rheinheimera sp.]|nr:MAG: sel1 repeat family protein [Rheinheimera sp.]